VDRRPPIGQSWVFLPLSNACFFWLFFGPKLVPLLCGIRLSPFSSAEIFELHLFCPAFWTHVVLQRVERAANSCPPHPPSPPHNRSRTGRVLWPASHLPFYFCLRNYPPNPITPPPTNPMRSPQLVPLRPNAQYATPLNF